MKKLFHIKFTTDFNDSKTHYYEAGKVYAFENPSRAMFLEAMGNIAINDYDGEVSEPTIMGAREIPLRRFQDFNEDIVEATVVEHQGFEEISKVLEEAGNALSDIATEEVVEESATEEVVEVPATEEEVVEEKPKATRTRKPRTSK